MSEPKWDDSFEVVAVEKDAIAIGYIIKYDEKPPTPEQIAKLIPSRFDMPEQNAITAEQVRLNRQLGDEACRARLGLAHCPDAIAGESCDCDEQRYRWVLEQLAKHPGVSSSARAVIEAALE